MTGETEAGVLGAAVATTSWADSPGAVRDRVVDLVADCVAVTALGSRRGELAALVDGSAAQAPEGLATVIGSARGWPASTAAFLNGCAVAADQLQDGHRPARGHPASHVVPAVLALAEDRNSPGEEALAAVLAGYEAGTRVGMAMGGTPDGVHDIGTWGQVAVAAAVARLLAPGDAAAARRALELSAAAVLLTDARTVFAGTTGSHAFLGASIQLGMSLGSAAVAGLAPAEGALDRHLGAVAARAWDPAPLVAGAGHPWAGYEVLAGYVKDHPTCAHLHGVNDAVADLVARGVRGTEVRAVEVRAFAGAAAFAAVADGELAARFSVPTSVAVALLTGRLDETTLDTATVTAPEVRALAGRVRVVHDPALDDGYPAGRPARVRVELLDGTEHRAESGRPRGDADRAFSRPDLAAKAGRLLGARFGAAAPDLLAAVHALADGGTPRELGAALRHAAGGAR
ncbi:MmgE/PrpD family protein [Blastococcus sp. VKM Ac-2987]|uniref:MmgE/PrpD family protein n=1 Tax=Blastococcus sp. VKM Ac-2987 TaxID=3004141 RepID=UPI0022ABB26E|nr:MmgE/PrpD family protein [Blastococcus sp. VKM Ac-2987]MCZ2859106.1 MmgE/PrpD family protein [Blastococcus sp. VKM Ac-2987]